MLFPTEIGWCLIRQGLLKNNVKMDVNVQARVKMFQTMSLKEDFDTCVQMLKIALDNPEISDEDLKLLELLHTNVDKELTPNVISIIAEIVDNDNEKSATKMEAVRMINTLINDDKDELDESKVKKYLVKMV